MNVFTLLNFAPPPNLLVAQASGNLLQQAVAISFVGIAIVFFALLTIMVMLVVLKKLGESPETRREEKPVVPPAPQPAVQSQISSQPAIPATVSASDSVQAKSTSSIVEPAAEEDEPEISPEIIAILTAAAIAALGTNVRIRKVRFADTTSNTAWAETGRRFIHTSHRLRKKDS